MLSDSTKHRLISALHQAKDESSDDDSLAAAIDKTLTELGDKDSVSDRATDTKDKPKPGDATPDTSFAAAGEKNKKFFQKGGGSGN